MIRNYIITAVRNLLRNPVYSLINVFGLSIGITCSLMILIYIKHETGYDEFHEKKDRLYRMVFEMVDPEGRTVTPQMTAPAGQDMMAEFPEVVGCTRFTWPRKGYFSFGGKSIQSDEVQYTDSSVFDMFSFRLLAGDPHKALTEPYSVVLGEELAGKLFGKSDPLGKVLKWNNSEDLVVTGIVESPPPTSSIRFNALISFSTLHRDDRLYMDWNGGMQYYHFIELSPECNVASLEGKLPDFMLRHINYIYKDTGASINAFLQNIRKIHLNSGFAGEMGATGSKSALILFSAIALFILLIACINFMNLTTARSTGRAREVGMRKVLGAGRKNLIRQFLGESVLMSVLGLIIALILVEILLPDFGQMAGRDLELYKRGNLDLLIGIPVFVILVGILAGSYPAFYLSSFRPVRVLKGLLAGRHSYAGLRNSLVLVQFTISIVLIICTLTLHSQLGYMRSRDLGYDVNNLLVLKMTSDPFKSKYKILKEKLSAVPGVISCSATSEVPGKGFTRNGYRPEGHEDYLMFHAVDVDYDYIKTMGLTLVEGRNFSKDFSGDRDAYLVNEELMRHLNWGTATDKTIFRGIRHPVIGVVKDFNFASLHEQIEPLVFTMQPYMGFDYLLVRYRSGNTAAVLSGIEKAWKSLEPGEPFNFRFYDEVFDEVYRTERKMSTILLYIAVLAILIAFLGLFGLALYNTEVRIREVGIRKVFGSTVREVVLLFSGKFTRWVLAANIFAWPVAYIIYKQTIRMYAYRIDFPLWIFLATSAGTYLVALITVSWQSLRAGRSNPADSLRYE